MTLISLKFYDFISSNLVYNQDITILKFIHKFVNLKKKLNKLFKNVLYYIKNDFFDLSFAHSCWSLTLN